MVAGTIALPRVCGWQVGRANHMCFHYHTMHIVSRHMHIDHRLHVGGELIHYSRRPCVVALRIQIRSTCGTVSEVWLL